MEATFPLHDCNYHSNACEFWGFAVIHYKIFITCLYDFSSQSKYVCVALLIIDNKVNVTFIYYYFITYLMPCMQVNQIYLMTIGVSRPILRRSKPKGKTSTIYFYIEPWLYTLMRSILIFI